MKIFLCPALRVEKGHFLPFWPYVNNEEDEHSNSSVSFRSPEGLEPGTYQYLIVKMSNPFFSQYVTLNRM